MDKFLQKREKNSMDQLLPDDVRTHIVSLLPLKEAGMPSLIGRPWRNIWKFINILKFDGREKLDSINSAAELEVERQRFVDWGNRVMSLHCGECIEEFKARFDLDITHAYDIDRWIEFALRKRVRYLELIFLSKLNFAKKRYSFPNVRRYMNNSPSLVLVSLSLIGMVLSQENLESFMEKLSKPERSISCTCKGLHHCPSSNSVEAFANVEITMKCQQLPRLKKLVLQMNVVTEAQILNLVDVMINGAPLLQTIVLKLLIGDLHVNPRIPEYPKEDEQRKKHECLKEVEIVGRDRGVAACDEVAMYVLECAPKLQKLVIDGMPFTTLEQFDSLRKELLSRGLTCISIPELMDC